MENLRMEDPRKQSLSRLLDAAAEKGVRGAAAVAKALIVSDQAINNWKTRGVPHAMAVKAQQLWTVSAQWVSTGEGAQWLDAATAPTTDTATQAPHEALVEGGSEPDLVIHQYDVGGAMGNNGFELDSTPPGLIKSWRVDTEWLRLNVPAHTGVANLCIVTGFGPSMKPRYNPGDPLLCDRGVTTVDSDGIYFFRVNGHGFIKQLQRIPTENGMILRAKSFNPDYDPFDITHKMDFEILGKILTVWRSEQF